MRQTTWVADTFTLFTTGLLAFAPMLDQAAWADEPKPEPITLESLIQQVMQKSPDVQAKKRAYEAARARVIAAWLPEDPAFGVDVEGQPHPFQFGDRTNLEYMASQTIPFPTTLILRGQVALRDAQIAHARYQEAIRNAIWHLSSRSTNSTLPRKRWSRWKSCAGCSRRSRVRSRPAMKPTGPRSKIFSRLESNSPSLTSRRSKPASRNTLPKLIFLMS